MNNVGLHKYLNECILPRTSMCIALRVTTAICPSVEYCILSIEELKGDSLSINVESNFIVVSWFSSWEEISANKNKWLTLDIFMELLTYCSYSCYSLLRSQDSYVYTKTSTCLKAGWRKTHRFKLWYYRPRPLLLRHPLFQHVLVCSRFGKLESVAWILHIALSLIHIWRCRRSTLCRSLCHT